MIKVSVLVAVHNAEPFLKECLDSLVGQSLADIQIICVDDASTDGSQAILEDYRRRDSRIEVIRTEVNVGMAKARNMALQHAKGEYVCMLDSDDWYSPDAMEQAVAVFAQHPETDCVLFRFVLAYPQQQGYRCEDYPSESFVVMGGAEACRKSLTWLIHGIYMVRTDIHRKFPYDDSALLYSDENTTRIHYLHSREVRCCDGVYYYRQHGQSETHKVTVRRFDKLKARESLVAQLDAYGCSADIHRQLVNMLWLDVVDLCMFLYVHHAALSPEEQRYGLSELHRVWQTIDRSQLLPKTTRKLGYMPMPRWWLFRLEEWVYFTLRGLLGKNE